MPKPNFELIERIRFQEPSKKLIYGLMGLLLVYVILRGLFAAAGKTLWYDELITLTVSSQGNWTAIVSALRRAVDGQPPLFYVIEHFASHFSRNQEIAFRLPSILAFPCTLACVFTYVKKRCGEIVGLLCAIFVLATNVFQAYAVEARPYSMLVACIAFALVCYQRAPSPVWTALLAISLATAQSLHYMAVLSMVPFGLAEAVHFWNTRKFRWSVWAALIVGVVPLFFFWKLLAINKAYYGTHFWSHYSLSSIPVTYGSFLLTGGAFGFALVAVCVVGIVGARLLPTNGTAEEGRRRDPAEASLLLTLLLLPFPAALAAYLLHGPMADRYVLASILGMALSLACVMSLARDRVVSLFAVFLFSTVAIHEVGFWRSSHSLRLNNPASPVEALLKKAGHPDLPVVISDGLIYLPIAHYASPVTNKRLVYLTDERKAVQYIGTDSIDKGLPLLRVYMALEIDPLSEFVTSHRTFLLYVVDQEGFNWLPSYLQEKAFSIQIISADGIRKVYLITMKEDAIH